MKIGVVTFYRVANYGAMLQAYALWHFLESKGHQVVFIAMPRMAPARIPLLRCFVSRSLLGVRVKLRSYLRHVITEFAASYPQTKICRSLGEVADATADCDAFIVGSDQMWNPMWCSGEFLPYVMLDFVQDGRPRIAYAASFGTREWPAEQNAEQAGELLRRFKAISVREESGIELVRRLSGRKDAKCLLDPTLLYDAQFYEKIIAEAAVREPRRKDPYIFKYLLEWDCGPEVQDALELVQQRLNISQVETDQIQPKGALGAIARLFSATGKISVPEWLSRIAHASFVFTNSFHGTVFAILFHKPFIALLLQGKMSGMNERVLSLLRRLGLANRVVSADNQESIQVAVDGKIDWKRVDRSILEQRKIVADFIGEAMGKELL